MVPRIPPHRETRFAPFRFADLPSVQQYLKPQYSDSIQVDAFVRWAHSIEASSDHVDKFFLREMKWASTPSSRKAIGGLMPCHEYLLLTFEREMHTVTFRVERDTNSWRTIFGLQRSSIRKDLIKIWDEDEARTSDDTNVATLELKGCSLISIRRFAKLLRITTAFSRYYNLWTFNCWWFVGQLWSNLVRALPEGVVQEFRKADDVASHLTGGSEALIFGRMKQLVHLECVKRFHGTPAVSKAAKEVELVTGLIEVNFGRGVRRAKDVKEDRRKLKEELRDLHSENVSSEVPLESPGLDSPGVNGELRAIIEQLRGEIESLKNEIQKLRRTAKTQCVKSGSENPTSVVPPSRTTARLGIGSFNASPALVSDGGLLAPPDNTCAISPHSASHIPWPVGNSCPPSPTGSHERSMGNPAYPCGSEPTPPVPPWRKPSFAQVVKTGAKPSASVALPRIITTGISQSHSARSIVDIDRKGVKQPDLPLLIRSVSVITVRTSKTSHPSSYADAAKARVNCSPPSSSSYPTRSTPAPTPNPTRRVRTSGESPGVPLVTGRRPTPLRRRSTTN
ncbi:hypothetical protein JAAARDRAFT_339722 [Jaapia argillacea MUCL 33604]|uniref:Uncharacterized protein n=1 Tax=Jaapia argillacea MUCL 33604 TaxID=933084 RepID=A0A067PJF5_9AGAM|nr:hypothetical protein JAAARDRAFT_339722 [Jaapia argillacea MUCL 33604]